MDGSHRSTSARAPSASAFFEGLLPTLLKRQPALTTERKGTICMMVHGEGVWTITLGGTDDDKRVRRELNLDADLTVVIAPAHLADIRAGTLSPDAAKGVAHMGDASLLTHLGRILAAPAPTGPVSLQTAVMSRHSDESQARTKHGARTLSQDAGLQ